MADFQKAGADLAVPIYLALGTNLGDRRINLATAIEQLQQHIPIEQCSSLYETEPAYVRDQPRYLNAVVSAHTALSPQALLELLKQIEHTMGRTAGIRFGPRLIDIDILLYGDLAITTPELTIPHPLMFERPFVLVPLAEIAPHVRPPTWKETVSERADQVRGNGDVIALVGQLNVASPTQS